ncbi:multidrug resistance-like protein [Nemania sp. FL0031]|nr:multidrug resistance-like protein [Nemania sp. FL0031]
MSNSTSITAACFPSADASFGPVLYGDNRGVDCRSFDFTIAFEQYFFSIAPAAILIVVASLRLGHLSKSPSVVAGNWFRLAKAATNVVFAAVQLSLVVAWASQSRLLGHVRTVSLAASAVSFLAGLLMTGLSYTEHARSRRPSFVLNAYLLASLLLDVAIVRSFWLSGLSNTICSIFSASLALKAVLLVMEAVEKGRFLVHSNSSHRNPELTSGLYSRGLIWWMNPLLLDGFRRLLRPDDLYSLDGSMSADVLHRAFWRSWNEVNPSANHRLILSCLRALKWPLVKTIVPRLFLLAFTISQPLALQRFLSFLLDPSQSISVGYSLIGAYGLIYIGIALSSAFYEHQNSRTLTMLRGILVSAIFSRSTELGTTDIDNSAAVTLMSTDVESINRAWREIHELWANIIQIPLAVWLLSIHIGFASVGPVIVCGIALFVSILSGPRSQKSMMAWIGKVQERIGITSTMLGHMKSIKMSGMGENLGRSIAQLRKDEIDAAAPFRIMSAVISAVAQAPALLSPVAAFALFTISGKSGESFDVTRVFTSLSLILLLGQPLFWILEAVLDTSAALASFKRIEQFISKTSRPEKRNIVMQGPALNVVSTADMESTVPDHQARDFELQNIDSVARRQDMNGIVLRNASFSWSSEATAIVEIKDMEICKGELAIVIGPVACGKTTLLRGLLGELPSITGLVQIASGRVAWCEQTPWLINGTVLKNIIGEAPYDEALYNSVIYACDLGKDLAVLDQGDQTIIGSKGIALSGGQRQRVALARLLYSRPQLAFLDDPFSGIDNHTSQIVFNRILSKENGLLREWGATIVLVTQAVKFLPDGDKIIALAEGSITEQGTFSSLRGAGGYVESLCREVSAGEADGDKTPSQTRSRSEEDSPTTRTSQPSPPMPDPSDQRRQRGDLSVYTYFFSSIGISFMTYLLISEVSWVFLSTFPTVWLNWWTEANMKEPNSGIGYYLGVYAALQILAVICFGVLTLIGIFYVASQVGIQMHQRLLDALLRAPLSLFTTTDIGSITTRFSQDIGILDRSLPLALLVTIASFLMAIGQAGLLASSTGYLAITFPFLILLFFYIQRGYLRTSRQLRLLDLEEKAPVYTQFLETLSGLVTIRAFGWSAAAVATNHSLVDKSQRPFYLLLMVQQWLTLVLNLITAALAILVVGLAVKLRDSVSASLTGVSLVQLITLAETLKLLIQFWTSLETSLGAVARIKNFSEETPDEKLPSENQQPPQNWPAQGHIEFRDVSSSYDVDGKRRALSNIDLKIEAGKKLGVVGRTGSGKSTFLLTLLRLVPKSSGTILVDGLDISTLDRDSLRSRIITVSQDTFYLPGSVRLNVDPYNSASSDAIETVLRRVGLWDVIVERGGLETKFEDDSLSHGQRQLFSLARAVLRKAHSRVIVFDEATSSVDAHTDALIRDFLRDEFQEHTVIWIAHRLETILDFDRVIVLDGGRVVEDGNPAELSVVRNTRFGQLWSARHRPS